MLSRFCVHFHSAETACAPSFLLLYVLLLLLQEVPRFRFWMGPEGPLPMLLSSVWTMCTLKASILRAALMAEGLSISAGAAKELVLCSTL